VYHALVRKARATRLAKGASKCKGTPSVSSKNKVKGGYAHACPDASCAYTRLGTQRGGGRLMPIRQQRNAASTIKASTI
jgi:hypothetical protein